MKKKKLAHLAFMGMTSGLLITSHLHAANPKSLESSSEQSKDPNDGNLGYHLMTEEELLLELTPEGMAMYNSLPPEGKALALQVASTRCGGSNFCMYLNACKTDKNDCAGKGECKGTGKCGLSDKNLAVKLVRDKLAKKRNDAMNHKK